MGWGGTLYPLVPQHKPTPFTFKSALIGVTLFSHLWINPSSTHTRTHLRRHKASTACLFLICVSPHDKRSDCIGAHKSVISDGMFMDKQRLPRWVAFWPGWGLLNLAVGRVAPAVKGHSVTERSGRYIQYPRQYIYHCFRTK